MSKRSLSVLAAHVVVAAAAVPKIATGREFSFIIQEGVALAVGNNKYGQLGVGQSINKVSELSPVSLPGEVDMVAAGAFHSLFLMGDGEAYASGRNNYGQLGLHEENMTHMTHMTHSPMPVALDGLVTAVAAGYAHSLFLVNGTVYAAGLNSVGQLGDNSTTSRDTPIPVLGLSGRVKAIAAGYDFSYFLMEDGDVFATGQNLGGQLGDGSKTSQKLPVRVKISGVASIAAGDSHGLFLKDNNFYGTGANFAGQISGGADGSYPKARSSPFLGINWVPSMKVFAGGDSSCVVGDEVNVFGSNMDGQIGLDSRPWMFQTMEIYIDGVAAVSLGISHALLVQNAGVVWSTGTNTYGELATNETTDSRNFRRAYDDARPPTRAPPSTLAPEPPTRAPGNADSLLPVLVVAAGVIIVLVGLLICCRADGETDEADIEKNMLPELSGATGPVPAVEESQMSEMTPPAPAAPAETKAPAPELESNTPTPATA